ncbi:MAG: tRNA preQ1(34) S-adenosylmethionine ribosyltransferase-isomerase QueA [Gemmataceae bacterium]
MFHFDLPPELIAQHPTDRRDQSRLLVVRRRDNTLSHQQFKNLAEFLVPGDLLVLNNTKVLPARLLGYREQTGGRWEGLFLRALENGFWELLSQTRGKLQSGETIVVEPGPLKLTLVEKTENKSWVVRPSESGPPHEVLQASGHIPLPPYIRKGLAGRPDHERYQTVYAERPGAVAAPTAGLHFTQDIFAELERRGIGRTFVTLHVGWGTFAPIKVEDYTQHTMHSEWGELPEQSIVAIKECKRRGGKVVAVGTTTVRVLETAGRSGSLKPWSGETDIYIYPPFEFQVIDALVTNFHLPETTLLLLVSAFAGTELMEKAYKTAITEGYRFYSYGDAMLIL